MLHYVHLLVVSVANTYGSIIRLRISLFLLLVVELRAFQKPNAGKAAGRDDEGTGKGDGSPSGVGGREGTTYYQGQVLL